jgi:hypothetical protein
MSDENNEALPQFIVGNTRIVATPLPGNHVCLEIQLPDGRLSRTTLSNVDALNVAMMLIAATTGRTLKLG